MQQSIEHQSMENKSIENIIKKDHFFIQLKHFILNGETCYYCNKNAIFEWRIKKPRLRNINKILICTNCYDPISKMYKCLTNSRIYIVDRSILDKFI